MSATEKNRTPARRLVPIPLAAIPPGMAFHASLDAAREGVREGAVNPGYLTVIERAWKEMGLDGVLCLDGRPILYHKEYGELCPLPERIRQHKLFWNQGVANVLVLADPINVYLYSGLAEPEENEGETTESALIRILGIAEYAERIHTLFRQLATGRFYEDHREYFDPEKSVDAYLLKNLRAFRDKLTKGNEGFAGKGLEIEEAHAFIGRILFLCYLLDRDIVDIGKPDGEGRGTRFLAGEVARREEGAGIDYLYGLFEDIRERFNGNMFERDLDTEKERIRGHLGELSLVLGGGEIKTGQFSLWPYYDFRMIPVETISAIYQDFLAAEDKARDKEDQRKTGAFYTPRFLAEMVVDMALTEEPESWEWSFLDPACGSGIFLVLIFNRLASQRLAGIGKDDHEARAEALQGILKSRIRGVDIAETACRIACFSLYLAYLDFLDSPEIEKYMGKIGKLPRLFHDPANPELPPDIPVIRKADFLPLGDDAFQGEGFRDGKFHCVIGNPPWEGRGSKQIAQRFMQESPRFLKSGGIGCFLLPTKILHNKTDAFQVDWIGRVTLEKVLQLADYRKLLFQGAKAPGFIARFRNAAPKSARHTVEFIAPKFNRDGLRDGLITVDPAARAWIPLGDVLAAARLGSTPIVWKQHLWGTRRDRKFLDLLQSLPPLAEYVDILSDLEKKGLARTKRWCAGQGLKAWGIDKDPSESDRNLKKNPWPLDTPFIETRSQAIHFILSREATISFKERLEKEKYRKDVLYSDPPHDLFFGPKVLVNQRFNKAAYCNFDVLFQHSLQSIAGPPEDAERLMFLAAYLESRFVRYFLFHTAANWGTERDKVHLHELLRLPFPLPGGDFIAPDAAGIIHEIAEKVRAFGGNPGSDPPKAESEQMSLPFSGEEAGNVDNNARTRKRRSKPKKTENTLQREIDQLIYRYFGLTEQEKILVEDTVDVLIPSATPGSRRSSIPTLDPVEKTRVASYKKKGFCAYGDTLARTLNRWAEEEGSRYRVRAEVGIDESTGIAMATLRLGKSEAVCQEVSLSDSLADVLKRYHETVSKKTGTLRYERDILFFEGDSIHIIRPDRLLNWTRAMALNDAARIYGEIVLGKEEDHAE
uniref:site-specific DNA-methyltransferase (adenine-specific) n=2 Tax=Candidatus Kentrum sp. TC TaxID=2126339 RepID=A0A450ZT22_9GAMM|nr:MAG: N-6 DNA Methylase [Candidatus Kentron sp. TC]